MLNFKEHFSFESYEKLHHLYSKNKEFFYKKINIFRESVVSFLQEKNNNESLVTSNEHHETYFQYAWNQLIQNEPIKNNVADKFNKYFLGILLKNLKLEKNTIQEKYESLINSVNQGSFSWKDLLIESNCGCCGQKMFVEFTQWKPNYVTFDFNEEKIKEPEKCQGKSIVELEIEFKSNKLIFSDWFRIEEFTNQVEFSGNINYMIEREKSTCYGVEQWNYISVYVGNTSPNIFQHKNEFIIGEKNQNEILPSIYKDKGVISTDLWNITIIEKEQLINIIANQLGQEKAQKKVEEYLIENDYVEVDITPGCYKLSFHPNYMKYQEEYTEELPAILNVLFTLSKK